MTYTPPKKHRWRKFNFEEWRNDEALKKCSRGARSLWLDMCGLIYAANDNGKLLLNGEAPDHIALARYFGDHGSAVLTWLTELETKGVFTKTPDGFIVSRRIAREFLKAENDARNGRKGGNPALLSTDNENEGVKAQKPHPESHIELAAKGVILSLTGPGMLDPNTNPGVEISLDRMLPVWLGLYDLELDIKPVIRARTAKVPASGKKIRSFDYLDRAIADHHAGRVSGLFALNAPTPPPKPKPAPVATTSPAQPIKLPSGRARVAAHAILEECGDAHYRARFATAEWNGTTVALDQWNINGVKPEARQILAEEGWEIVAKG